MNGIVEDIWTPNGSETFTLPIKRNHPILPRFDRVDEEILSSEFVYLDEEIYAEFQERCEEARLDGGQLPAELQEATKALSNARSRF